MGTFKNFTIDCMNNQSKPLIDRSVFQKTPEEKEKLRLLKRKSSLLSKGTFRDIHRKPNGKLILHSKSKNDVGIDKFKNTSRYSCPEHEIKTIISALHKDQIITKCQFNGVIL